MKPDDLVTLRTFSNLVDAQVAIAHLESQGIKAIIKKDDSGGMRPHFQQTHGVDVVVRQKDAKKAEKVLLTMSV